MRSLKAAQQAAEYEKRRTEYMWRFGSSELSMVVGAYAIASQLVDDPGTRSKISSQARKLGNEPPP